jgi:hypothetical protein
MSLEDIKFWQVVESFFFFSGGAKLRRLRTADERGDFAPKPRKDCARIATFLSNEK